MEDSGGFAGRMGARATTACLPRAHPMHHFGDEGVVGGVVVTVSVGQEVVTQHMGSNAGTDQRRREHGGTHVVPLGPGVVGPGCVLWYGGETQA